MKNKIQIQLWSVILMLCLNSSSAKRTVNLGGRVIGGVEAGQNEFPFTVSIRRTEIEDILGYGNHICGGALINDNKVVTAGHCMFDKFGNFLGNPNSYIIVFGTTYRLKRGFQEQIRKSQGVYLHPKFSLQFLYNDIAIIILDAPLVLDGVSVKTIPMATKSFPEGTPCVINGWGTILSFPGLPAIIPDDLQKGEVFISSKLDCKKNYRIVGFTIVDSQICAGVPGGEVDGCKGDSGGPLVCNGSLYGVMSTGEDCGKKGFPGIYTDLTKFIDFIINPENFDPQINTSVNYNNSNKAYVFSKQFSSIILIFISIVFFTFTCII